MKQFCVYILYSPSADKFYVGQTDNLDLRLEFHNLLSENSFTARFRPWVLKLSIPVNSRSEALSLEKYIKRRKSRKFLVSLIENQNKVNNLIQKLGPDSSAG